MIRATVTPTCLPVIRGIKDPKKAYETLIKRISQDNGLEVAALIAQVTTIRYLGNESVSTFLDNMNNLHTKLSEATSQDPDLCISDKLLAVFLLMSFPGENFGTIRDQLFGDLKNLTTSKVVSRIKTKSALTSVDESVTAMAASANQLSGHTQPQPTPSRPVRSVCFGNTQGIVTLMVNALVNSRALPPSQNHPILISLMKRRSGGTIT